MIAFKAVEKRRAVPIELYHGSLHLSLYVSRKVSNPAFLLFPPSRSFLTSGVAGKQGVSTQASPRMQTARQKIGIGVRVRHEQ